MTTMNDNLIALGITGEMTEDDALVLYAQSLINAQLKNIKDVVSCQQPELKLVGGTDFNPSASNIAL